MDIKYFTSKIPNDQNHVNEHALINNDIEFVKFPYSFYYGRKLNKHAEINYNCGVWYVSIWNCLETGKCLPLNNRQFKIKDNAFIFAYNSINEIGS